MSEAAKNKKGIGFIGIGLMGHGTAKNILEKDYPLTFLGRASRTPADDLTSRGGLEVKTARHVGRTFERGRGQRCLVESRSRIEFEWVLQHLHRHGV